MLIKYRNILFDGFTVNNFEDSIEYIAWSGICNQCREKYFPIVNDMCGGLCGIYGCDNDADVYIDMHVDFLEVK